LAGGACQFAGDLICFRPRVDLRRGPGHPQVTR
jgi:hypothetical protein